MRIFGTEMTLAEGGPGSASKLFNTSRRRFIDQVFRREQLTATDKLIGFAISSRVNRQTGYTFAHPSTLGRDVGIKYLPACRAIEHLGKAGLLRQERRDDHVHLFPTPLLDASPPVIRGYEGIPKVSSGMAPDSHI
jgi:hypothetical protein